MHLTLNCTQMEQHINVAWKKWLFFQGAVIYMYISLGKFL